MTYVVYNFEKSNYNKSRAVLKSSAAKPNCVAYFFYVCNIFTMARKPKTKTKRNVNVAAASSSSVTNFVSEAGLGCHIARHTNTNNNNDWVLEWERVDPDDFDADDDVVVPDIAVDPDNQTLTLCNLRSVTIVAYITVYDLQLYGRNRQPLAQGTTTTTDETTTTTSRVCTTLIVLCPPLTFCHLCSLNVTDDISCLDDLPLDSDVQEWNQHPNPDDSHSFALCFPLQGNYTKKTSFLCTQGVDGHLTHFFSGNLHAIDFQCPVGTPLLAAANGVVLDACDQHVLTGIAVSNLFTYNSILLELDVPEEYSTDGPLFVEYVHIATSLVKKGDRVVAGQVIGASGSVGFSPEPHLHFAAYKSRDKTAATTRILFRTNDTSGGGGTFLPIAGQRYCAKGLVSNT
jgi:hypothetical protein